MLQQVLLPNGVFTLHRQSRRFLRTVMRSRHLSLHPRRFLLRLLQRLPRQRQNLRLKRKGGRIAGLPSLVGKTQRSGNSIPHNNKIRI